VGALRQRKVATLQNSYMEQHKIRQQYVNKQKKRLVRRLTVFFMFVIVVSYALISSLLSRHTLLEEKLAQKEQLEKKLAALEKEEELLKEEIVKLNDDEYIAKLARREYFLSDQGEIIFNLPEKDDKEKEEDSSY
jgi:cell division protein DivIC